MKNLLNQDLVCGGASGEWVMPSGEWVLGSGEWTLKRRTIRWWRFRHRARRLLRGLLRSREQVATASWRGVGLGLTLTVVEAVLRIPSSFHFQLLVPAKVIACSMAFNLVLGVMLALAVMPLLQLRRGRLWHALVTSSLLAILLLAVEGPLPSMWPQTIVAGGPGAIYLAALGLARWRRLHRLGTAILGTVALAAALGVPAMTLHAQRPDASKAILSPEVSRQAPNVLLIVLDTLRADRLEVMGYERTTFPWLADFAREGAVFERALSAAPWTLPSHASMFTGLYPSEHGAHHEHTHLAESRTTLAEMLRDQGWETVAFSSNPWLSGYSGLTQGFNTEEPVWSNLIGTLTLAYRAGWMLGWVNQDLSGREMTESWLMWLERWKGDRPFFAFLNYVEPHIPYHVLPKGYLTTFSPAGTSRDELVEASKEVMAAEITGGRASPTAASRVKDLYDAAIYYEGGLVASTVEALRQRNILDNTIVVLVSDHGDLLGEHGGLFQHTRSLANYLLSVPLIVRYPPRVTRGQRIQEPVTTAALMPTILDLVGLNPPEGIHTRSFAPLFDGNPAAARSPLLAENYKDRQAVTRAGFSPRSDFDRLDVRYRALEEDGWKLVVDSTGKSWLFRPVEDPTEERDYAAEHPEIVDRLMAELQDLTERDGLGEIDAEMDATEPIPEIDPTAREHLRSLGYVGG